MRAQEEKRRFFTRFIIPAILALIAVLSMLLFQYSTVNLAKEQTYQTLYNSAKEQTATLREAVEGRLTLLESFANSLSSQTNEFTLEDITARMNAIVAASDFENLAVADKNGITYTNDGQIGDYSDRQYMTEALSGRRAVQKLTDSRLYQKSRLVLSVPLYVNGEIRGAVMGSFSDEYMQELLVSSAFDGCAYSFFSDSNGEIVISAEAPLLLHGTDNLLEKFANMELLDGTTVQGIRDDLKTGNNGVAVYGIGGERRYAIYRPTGINDWYIFNVVSDAVVNRAINAQNRLGILCIGIVCVCAILLLVIMAAREKHRVTELKRLQEEQLARYRTDPVTGLLNTMGFAYAAQETLQCLPDDGFCAVVDFSILNLTYFSVSYGRPAGDAMLRDTARTLVEHCRVKQPCARLSDDRFACLVTDCRDRQELLERIAILDERLHTCDGTHQLVMAYGVYIVDDRSLPVTELCTRAVAARLRMSQEKA